MTHLSLLHHLMRTKPLCEFALVSCFIQRLFHASCIWFCTGPRENPRVFARHLILSALRIEFTLFEDQYSRKCFVDNEDRSTATRGGIQISVLRVKPQTVVVTAEGCHREWAAIGSICPFPWLRWTPNRFAESRTGSDFGRALICEEQGGPMIYGSLTKTKVPEVVAQQFPEKEEFGYELMQLRLRAVCDTLQERDSLYRQAKDAHTHVATVGPRLTQEKRWYGIYW